MLYIEVRTFFVQVTDLINLMQLRSFFVDFPELF